MCPNLPPHACLLARFALGCAHRLRHAQGKLGLHQVLKALQGNGTAKGVAEAYASAEMELLLLPGAMGECPSFASQPNPSRLWSPSPLPHPSSSAHTAGEAIN